MSRARIDLKAVRSAFVFPGVGVRFCGHEAEFFERHAAVMTPALDEASDAAGASFIAAIDAAASGLDELQGQLFTYAFNYAVAQVMFDAGARPALMAGHSMGLYSALAASRAISFKDGLDCVAAAYRIVNEAARRQGASCALAVIVGLNRKEIEALLEEQPRGHSAQAVNWNNDSTAILAGLRDELAGVVEAALERDALKARLLPVSAPYHHSGLLQGTSELFEQELCEVEWSPPICPIVSSIDQELLESRQALITLTARNIARSIDWERVVDRLGREEIELALECGAGLSLTQNSRLIPTSPPFVNVKSARRRLGL